MDTGPGPSLYPLHRCKIVHLVRHAQGLHNVEGEKNHKAHLNPEYLDAPLTQLGWQQVNYLRKHVHASGLSKRVELVVTSPLLRTLQTAVGVFGGEGYTDGMNALPQMVANVGNSGRAASSSLHSPPFLAVEDCREHFGVHPCDKRHNVSEYQFLFPAVDFSLIETDEDVLWKADVRETTDELAARGLKFLNWLWTRKEREIAIVTHSGFLVHTFRAFGNDCHPSVKKEICTRWLGKHAIGAVGILHEVAAQNLKLPSRGRMPYFDHCTKQCFANCELRSMVIVDRSMIGSDVSTTNYPGKIPSGLDLASDVAEEAPNSF